MTTKATQRREWSIGENAYGGTSIFEGRKERYSNVQKLNCDFTEQELAEIVTHHNEYDRLKRIEAALLAFQANDCHVTWEAVEKALAATPESARAESAKQAEYVKALEAVAEAAVRHVAAKPYNGQLPDALAALQAIRAK